MCWISISTLVKMQRPSATRPFSLLVILATWGLVFCVFAWGLQYKLSLYDPTPPASHQVPQAKLLSRDEQTATTAGPQVFLTKTSTKVSYTVPTIVFLVLLLLCCALKLQWPGQREERASDSWRLRRGQLNGLFVRPPPFLI